MNRFRKVSKNCFGLLEQKSWITSTMKLAWLRMF